MTDVKGGHQYRAEISLAGDLDSQTGQLKVRQYFPNLYEEIIRPLNNSLLNTHFHFTSGEQLSRYIFEECKKRVPKRTLKQVTIQKSFANRYVVTDELLSNEQQVD